MRFLSKFATKSRAEIITTKPQAIKNQFFWFRIKFSILVLYLIKSSIFTPLLKIF